jgi:uncharacterized lipoprotein YddW (UPF0748 family)
MPRSRHVWTVFLALLQGVVALSACDSGDATAAGGGQAGQGGAAGGPGGDAGEQGGTAGAWMPSGGSGATDGGKPVVLPEPEVALPLSEGDGQTVSAAGAVRTLRGLWEPDVHLKEIPADEAEGLAEIKARVARMRAAGFNAFMPVVYSQYIDAVRDPAKYESATPPSAWDALGRYIDEARAAGMEIHLWYSPVTMKEAFRANELKEHPEWCLELSHACISGSNGPKQVELANDAARAWQVEAARFLAERYRPDAIQLEEPYYHLSVSEVPTNDAFTQKYRDRFGEDPPAEGDWRVSAIKRQVLDALGKELRAALLSVDGAISLHVNVATAFESNSSSFDRTGLHPDVWVMSGWLDGWEPQLYDDSVGWFGKRLAAWQSWHPGTSVRPFETHVTLIPGVELYFSSFDDENPVAFTQTMVAEEGGSGANAASGSALFSFIPGALAKIEGDLAGHPPAALQGTLGNSVSAEPSSDPTWVPGPAGGSALRFDGDADFVRIPGAYAFDEYGAFTFAARLRMEPGDRKELETIVSRGSWSLQSGYVWIYSRADGCIWYEIADGEADTSRPFQSDKIPSLYDGAWHWLVVTQDRAARTIKFYFDGAESGTRTYEGWSRPAVHGDFYLGTYGGSTDTKYSFHGDMADVRWYRRTLDSAQVQSLTGSQ